MPESWVGALYSGTVSTILKLVANGMNVDVILKDYPYLDAEYVQQALQQATWLADETHHAQNYFA